MFHVRSSSPLVSSGLLSSTLIGECEASVARPEPWLILRFRPGYINYGSFGQVAAHELTVRLFLSTCLADQRLLMLQCVAARVRFRRQIVQPGRQAGGVVDKLDERRLQRPAEVHRGPVLQYTLSLMFFLLCVAYWAACRLHGR